MGLKSWFPIPKSSGFSLANIPFGIISTSGNATQRAAVAIGEHCLDLGRLAVRDGFSECETKEQWQTVFSQPTLNSFAALGRPVHRSVRKYIQDLLREDTPFPQILKDNQELQDSCIFRQDEVTMHLPMQIGDYTDFYAGKNHAYTMGCILRDPKNALQPNYMHLPVAYHSRASSVVVSGTPIVRPNGQILENPAAEVKKPVFKPTQRLDIELELGAFICKPNQMGQPVPIAEAEENIFGLVLLNDWSARDIQAWEYVPLGPFNAKNFASTISPWVCLIDALGPFRTEGIKNENELLPYLQEKNTKNVFDIRLQVELTPKGGKPSVISNSNGKYLVYSFPQMLAHHTIGGCPMNVGDLIGSGTISGTDPGTQGAMVEITKGGKETIQLEGGEERKFLQDGDTMIIRGVCGNEEDGLVGFGDCTATILPAPKLYQ
ncbi:hypothetical protein LTS08_005223 [Lithohypha guttulata]|nr:hypothetical protein LTS08_005223 [Lithohypha guttulata]